MLEEAGTNQKKQMEMKGHDMITMVDEAGTKAVTDGEVSLKKNQSN